MSFTIVENENNPLKSVPHTKRVLGEAGIFTEILDFDGGEKALLFPVVFGEDHRELLNVQLKRIGLHVKWES